MTLGFLSSFLSIIGIVFAGTITFIVYCILYESGTRTPEEQKQEDELQIMYLQNNRKKEKKAPSM